MGMGNGTEWRLVWDGEVGQRCRVINFPAIDPWDSEVIPDSWSDTVRLEKHAQDWEDDDWEEIDSDAATDEDGAYDEPLPYERAEDRLLGRHHLTRDQLTDVVYPW